MVEYWYGRCIFHAFFQILSSLAMQFTVSRLHRGSTATIEKGATRDGHMDIRHTVERDICFQFGPATGLYA